MLTCVSDLIRTGAPEGQRNDRAFWLACQLRDDRMSEGEARQHMTRFAGACRPPLPEHEAEAALHQAFKGAPRDRAEESARDGAVGVVDFGESAPADGPGGWNPAGDLVRYLKATFRDGEQVRILPALRGQGTARRASELIEAVRREGVAALGDLDREAGCWVIHNPTDGVGRTDANVTELRHVLVECDDLPAEQQRAIIEELRLPCAAVVDAGNKSVHAIVRIDAGTDAKLYADRVGKLYDTLEARGYPVDRKCGNAARLSRLPGVWRGDRRQWLISTNTGCASWGEWLDHLDGVKRRQHDVEALAALDVSSHDDSIIKPRFMTREGSWLIVASSGVGKSSLTMQHAMLFALGLPVFGLEPARPLRSLVVQAENCELDLAEQVQGVVAGERLDGQDVAEIRRNLVLMSEDSRCGAAFHEWLDRTISAHMPIDLVWLDPLLAYLGCGVNEQEKVTVWLRNGLNPIIHRHGVAVVVLHHTGKVRKQANEGDYVADYVGAGTSDLTNWARAVSFAEKTGDGPVTVQWQHAKRGGRLPPAARSVEIRHSEEGRIHWVTCTDLDRDERDRCLAVLSTMPPLKNRYDHAAEDSMHAWAIREMRISPNQAVKLVNSQRVTADAVSCGRKTCACSLLRHTDSAGVTTYRGARVSL
jgi:RecA-family ATPase